MTAVVSSLDYGVSVKVICRGTQARARRRSGAAARVGPASAGAARAGIAESSCRCEPATATILIVAREKSEGLPCG